MENNRYGNINELISEIEALGDWRDVSQRSNFLKVLSKIAMIYYGYEINPLTCGLLSVPSNLIHY